MATIRTMNRRRRMRHYENHVVGVYASDADGNMTFYYEKAVAGRWQRYTPRGMLGSLAEHNADLGQIVVTDEELVDMLDQFEGMPPQRAVDEMLVGKVTEAAGMTLVDADYEPESGETLALIRVDGAR